MHWVECSAPAVAHAHRWLDGGTALKERLIFGDVARERISHFGPVSLSLAQK